MINIIKLILFLMLMNLKIILKYFILDELKQFSQIFIKVYNMIDEAENILKPYFFLFFLN